MLAPNILKRRIPAGLPRLLRGICGISITNDLAQTTTRKPTANLANAYKSSYLTQEALEQMLVP